MAPKWDISECLSCSFYVRTYRNWDVSSRDGNDGGDDGASGAKGVGKSDSLRCTTGGGRGHGNSARASTGRDRWLLSRDSSASRDWVFRGIVGWDFGGNSSAGRDAGASWDSSSSRERESDGLDRAIRWWFYKRVSRYT